MPKRGWLFGGDVAAARMAALESVANLTAKSQSDREDRRLEAEQERVQNEVRRDAVGSYRFRIETGDTITESELRADATLQDRDRAQLLAAARGAAPRVGSRNR